MKIKYTKSETVKTEVEEEIEFPKFFKWDVSDEGCQPHYSRIDYDPEENLLAKVTVFLPSSWTSMDASIEYDECSLDQSSAWWLGISGRDFDLIEEAEFNEAFATFRTFIEHLL